IVLDTFDPFFSRRVKRGLDIAAEVICAAAFAGAGILVWLRAVRVAGYGDTTAVLKLPLAPVAYLMGTMIIVACVIHLSLIFVPHRPDDGQSIV
ncbi:MAG: hypothetical protein ACREXI_07230, partial [Caldimonas sp.]